MISEFFQVSEVSGFPPKEGGGASSETQGQIKVTRESLNGRKNIYGMKKSRKKTCVFLAPIRSQNGGDRLELIW